MGAATIAAIASGIVAIAKAIPAGKAIIAMVVTQFYAVEETQDHDRMTEVQKERDMLLATIEQPGITDAQKRTARKRLIALSAH